MAVEIVEAKSKNGHGGKRPGSGRKKGVPNKVTHDLRVMVREALEQSGGVDYLKKQANDNPNAFMALIGKSMPKEVTAEVNHSGGIVAEVKINVVKPTA